jgi:hypothetical protein
MTQQGRQGVVARYIGVVKERNLSSVEGCSPSLIPYHAEPQQLNSAEQLFTRQLRNWTTSIAPQVQARLKNLLPLNPNET